MNCLSALGYIALLAGYKSEPLRIGDRDLRRLEIWLLDLFIDCNSYFRIHCEILKMELEPAPHAAITFRDVRSAGPPTRPLDFPPPQVRTGIRVNALVVHPESGSRQVCSGVIHREDLSESSASQTPKATDKQKSGTEVDEVLAYWPQRRLQDAIYGSVWACLVLRRHHGVAADDAARAAGVDDRAMCSDQILRSMLERPPTTVDQVATILGLLCTECPRRTVEFSGQTYFVATGPRGLPQGACTSPALSNQVARRLDKRLQGIAAKLSLSYTRYADDLTLSGQDSLKTRIGYVMARVRHIADDEGFVVNEKKSRVQRRNTAQTVTTTKSLS